MGDDLRQRTQFLRINHVGSMNNHTRHSLQNCLRYATLRKHFPCSDCVGCIYKRKRLAGTNCVGCTCDRKQFCRIIVFFSTTIRISVFERSPVAHDRIIIVLALLYVFPYLSARRLHTTSFCRACVPGGHIPDGFWVM